METRLIDRIAALTGAAYVVIAVLANDVLASPLPDSTESSHAIGAWWRAHPPGNYTWGLAFLELISLLCFSVFIVVLSWRLRQADRSGGWLPWLVLVAGTLSAGVKLASAAPIFAVAWRADNGISDQLAAALVDMNNAAFVLTWALDALVLAAAGALILTTRCLPRWLGWFGAVSAPLLLATVPIALVGPPTFLLALLWIVATSIALATRGLRAPRKAAVTARA